MHPEFLSLFAQADQVMKVRAAEVGDLTPNDYKKGTTKMFLKKSTARLLDGRQGKVLRSGAALVEDLIRMAASSRVKRSYARLKLHSHSICSCYTLREVVF